MAEDTGKRCPPLFFPEKGILQNQKPSGKSASAVKQRNAAFGNTAPQKPNRKRLGEGIGL